MQLLRISEVVTSDEGQYECQVSTAVKLSQVFSLKVVIPQVSPIIMSLIMNERDCPSNNELVQFKDPRN